MKRVPTYSVLLILGVIAVALTSNLTSVRISHHKRPAEFSPRVPPDAMEARGNQIEIQGIVIGDYRQPDQLGGFFLQLDDPKSLESWTIRSAGMFVAADPASEIAIGDRLRLRGLIDQSGERVQIKPEDGNGSLGIEKLGHSDSIEAIELPPLSKAIEWETFEGMLVRFPTEMIVTDTYDLSRYGQVKLAADRRIYVPTNSIDPNDQDPSGNSFLGRENVRQVRAAQEQDQQCVILDDGSMVQNPAQIPWLPRPNEPSISLRLGSKFKNLTGIVTRIDGKFVILPTTSQAIEYAPRFHRPQVGDPNLTIASFNVLNYFTTIDDGKNGARGADSVEELDRQRGKLTAALIGLEADIVGLVELENNVDSEQDLVKSINDQLGDDIYAGVGIPDQFQDAPGGKNPIRVGLIYRRDRVEPSGPVSTIVDDAFSNARAPVAQQFRRIGGEAKFRVIVNHFKSKGSDGASRTDQDQQDGQSAFNASRRNQAAALANYATRIRQSIDRQHILFIGDLNAYSQEDPIDRLRGAGLVDLLQQHAGAEQPYSYVYRGQAGCLDHALATPELATMVTGAKVWHINSDEPRFLDYNVEYNPPSLFRPDPFRSSDHDPILIGLRLP